MPEKKAVATLIQFFVNEQVSKPTKLDFIDMAIDWGPAIEILNNALKRTANVAKNVLVPGIYLLLGLIVIIKLSEISNGYDAYLLFGLEYRATLLSSCVAPPQIQNRTFQFFVDFFPWDGETYREGPNRPVKSKYGGFFRGYGDTAPLDKSCDLGIW